MLLDQPCLLDYRQKPIISSGSGRTKGPVILTMGVRLEEKHARGKPRHSSVIPPQALLERTEQRKCVKPAVSPGSFPPTGPLGGRLSLKRSRSRTEENAATHALLHMDIQSHWEKIYTEKASDEVSWYRPHLETSLALIERVAPGRHSSIIDVGAGESSLVGDLLARGYENVTILDISQTAVDADRKRLRQGSELVHWLVADVTKAELEPRAYDVWHDRAVFHFLTLPSDRTAYVRQVTRALKPGGSVIVGVFGPQGPARCSGLEVVRYDAESLHKEFGAHFRLLCSSKELHKTPSGSLQQFLYCSFVLD